MKIASEIAGEVFPELKSASAWQKDMRLGAVERCEEIIAAKLGPVKEAFEFCQAHLTNDPLAVHERIKVALARFEEAEPSTDRPRGTWEYRGIPG